MSSTSSPSVIPRSAKERSEGWVVSGHVGPYAKTMGVYKMEGEAKDHQFKHEKTKAYLYFQAEEKRWTISNVMGASRCWMFAQQSTESSPEQQRQKGQRDGGVHPQGAITGWRYLDPEKRKWKRDRNMKCIKFSRIRFRRLKPSKAAEKAEEVRSQSLPHMLGTNGEDVSGEIAEEEKLYQDQHNRLKSMERLMKELIEENKELMGELSLADSEMQGTTIREDASSAERVSLETKNGELEAKVEHLEGRASALQEESEEREELEHYVAGMVETVGILHRQLDQLHTKCHEVDRQMLALSTEPRGRASKSVKDHNADDDDEYVSDEESV
mmetsp:Transcript_18879/g.30009  ORF Transcript_18879/g.30009 Transcript_18879/m.30009 type:complete len:328 (-) Transcript_18879:207-1190(-)